jgi:hypothetical protein
MLKPQILGPDYGRNNADLDATIKRVSQTSSWKKLDTVMIIPAGGMVPTKCVAAWMNLYAPPNNKLYRLWALGQEVGQAYSNAIQNVLDHPELSKFKYVVTLEHDNAPQPDALVKLLETMEAYPQFACIGGLYFTKGDNGQAQIWGDPRDPQINFRPQVPAPNTVQECCGTGMGFNAFRLDMFKDPKLRKPWFHTQTEGGVATQDLYFWSDARKHGYRCAVHTGIPVGHLDVENDIMW